MTFEQQIATWYVRAKEQALDAQHPWMRRAIGYVLASVLVLGVVYVLWAQRERTIYLENRLDIAKHREASAQARGAVEVTFARSADMLREANVQARKALNIEHRISDQKKSRRDIAETLRDVAGWENLREKYDDM